MRALIIEHGQDGGAEGVGEKLQERGFTLEPFRILDDITNSYSDRPFPEIQKCDLLVVMGSVHSVYDVETIGSWIGREIDLVTKAIAQNQPVLGICFGGQVLSKALGGVVKPAKSPEIGWHTIQSNQPENLPEGPWFQWHYDQFSLPVGAIEIAHNNHGIQAFHSGRNLGVQFHPEVTPDLVSRWLDHLGEEIHERGINRELIISETQNQHPGARDRADQLVDWFLDEVAFK